MYSRTEAGGPRAGTSESGVAGWKIGFHLRKGEKRTHRLNYSISKSFLFSSLSIRTMRTRSQAAPRSGGSAGARASRLGAGQARSLLLAFPGTVRRSSHRTPAARGNRVLGSQSPSSRFPVFLSTRLLRRGLPRGSEWWPSPAGETRRGAACRAFGGAPTPRALLFLSGKFELFGQQQGL